MSRRTRGQDPATQRPHGSPRAACVRDHCDGACRRPHLMDDGVTPRVPCQKQVPGANWSEMRKQGDPLYQGCGSTKQRANQPRAQGGWYLGTPSWVSMRRYRKWRRRREYHA